MASLEASGARDTLADVYNRTLNKLAKQSNLPDVDDLDDTIRV